MYLLYSESPNQKYRTFKENWKRDLYQTGKLLASYCANKRNRSTLYADKALHGWWHINILFPGLLVSRRGKCFWGSRSCMCNKVWKVWEGGQSIHWKGSRTWAQFWNTQITRIWSFLKTATHFICFASCCYSLSRTHHSRYGLHGVVAAFMLSVLSSVFVADS